MVLFASVFPRTGGLFPSASEAGGCGVPKSVLRGAMLVRFFVARAVCSGAAGEGAGAGP